MTPRNLIRLLIKLGRLLPYRLYRAGLRHGVAAAVEHEAIPFDRSYRSILDVGAAKGQFALFARQRFPRAELHCFEPLPTQLQKLNLVTNLIGNSRIHECALGDQSGTADMWVTADGDSSSLRRITDRQVSEFPGTTAIGKATVDVKTLAEATEATNLQPPALLKIDVQGSELAVIRGAGHLISRFDDVLVECSFVELYEEQALVTDVIRELSSSGFMLAGMHSPQFDPAGHLLQVDLLFTSIEPSS